MVDLQYVKRRKRKRIAELVAAVGSVITAVFVIVAFLGVQAGTFTVAMKSSNVKLSLSTTPDFEEPTSHLRVTDVQKMDTYCYQEFKNELGKLDFSSIDTPDTTYLDFAYRKKDGTVSSVPFFKYTFFVRNEGETEAQFTMNLNILENIPDPETKRTLDGLLRVLVFEDGVMSDVFAKRSTDGTHYDPTKDPTDPDYYTDREYIDGNPESDIYEGLATRFINNTLIVTLERNNFGLTDVSRYTVLYWLEGHDYPEGYFDQPKDAKLKLGVEINAYENQ